MLVLRSIFSSTTPAIFLAAIETVDEAKWRHAWELKVFGYINLTRAMLSHMKPRGKGVIVNVIGMAGVTHPPEYICGTMGNAALEAFTKGVGKGSIEYGVRVLGMHPPSTRTDRIILKTAITPLRSASIEVIFAVQAS